MKKSLFRDKDIFFSTIFVFAFIGLLKLSFLHIPQLDPIHAAFEDFEISDIVYQHKRDNKVADINNPIVIVEIGNTREEIAAQVEAINAHTPKVIAVDAYFLSPSDSVRTDSILLATFSKANNLVVGCFIENAINSEELVVIKNFIALDSICHSGFINFVGEESKTIRYFSPTLQANGEPVNSFAAEIVRLFDSTKYQQLIQRGKGVERINFSHSPSQYIPVIAAGEVTDGSVPLDFLKDKIVILGAIDSSNLNDLHFTPMNQRMAGRSKPDMPGVFIHANIVEMILSGSYITKIPDWVMFVFSVLFTYITTVFYVYYFVEKHIWYHLMAKIVQFAFFGFFVYIEVMLLNKWQISLSDKIVLVPIVLLVDLLYFYDAFVKWLHKRFGYSTYFMHGH
ncbi:MAG: CHASE2 domain-containing protein [Chitinophagales bacterium]|nr:CHASE2 domain-containing protein [Chitinophagales bacterium]